MRISDWSSDVCSSDLVGPDGAQAHALLVGAVLVIDGLAMRAAPERQAFETRRTVVVAGQCEVGDLSVDVHAGHLVLCIDKTRHRKQAGRQAGNPFGLHTCILRDRKSTRLNSSHECASSMPSSP